MLRFSICFISSISLFLSTLLLFLLGFYFVLNDLIYFIEWDIITLNSSRIVTTFLFDWMSLTFMGFFFLFRL
jgi:NADH-ubiquinone oxidoreductase chain 5